MKIREQARKFRVYARKLQTLTEQCFTQCAGVTITRFRRGTTIRGRRGAPNDATRHLMTQKVPLTSEYTTRKEPPSSCKEVQSGRKENHLLEQGNRGTGEQGNRGTALMLNRKRSSVHTPPGSTNSGTTTPAKSERTKPEPHTHQHVNGPTKKPSSQE